MNKKEAWEYYKRWMREKTYNRALNAEIKITRKGWDHIVRGSKNTRRTQRDKFNKFKLLKDAKRIIKLAKIFEISVREEERYYVLKETKKKKNSEIRVILKKDKEGRYYFYTVMKH